MQCDINSRDKIRWLALKRRRFQTWNGKKKWPAINDCTTTTVFFISFSLEIRRNQLFDQRYTIRLIALNLSNDTPLAVGVIENVTAAPEND